MKHFTHNSMAIFAFAALLATPPAILEHSHVSRSIASEAPVVEVDVNEGRKIPEPKIKILEAKDLAPLPKVELPMLKSSDIKVSEPEVKVIEAKDLAALPKIKLPELKHGDINVAHPRYDKLVEKVSENKSNEDLELSLKVFKQKRDKLKEEIAKLKDDKSDKKSDKIEELAIDLLLVEGSLKDLKEKKVISPKESDESRLVIYDAKNELEFILMDLEKASEEKTSKSEEKSEKKEIAKKEESKEEVKKEKDKAEVACAADEKVSVLTKQVQQLMDDQNKVMQNMLSMSQMMMMNMMLQQQKQMQQPQQSVPYQYPNQSAYQYQQPQTAGSWVYYPQGFQPYQNNIFSSPQLTQYQGGFYPDQVHQQQQPQQSGWNLQPSMNFNTSSMVTPGTFGGNGTSFNMSNSVPTISQR